MNRDYRQQLARETLTALENGTYDGPTGPVDFAEAQRAAVAGSRLYRPADAADLLRDLTWPPGPLADVRVQNATTLAAAAQLAADFGRVGVLNFASARNPGGGFLGGSQAQEESLARSSGLYPCLTQFAEMYAYNSLPASTALYSDHLIYSPGVPVLRSDDGQWLPRPLLLDIITAPAVNAGALARNAPPATAWRRWCSAPGAAASSPTTRRRWPSSLPRRWPSQPFGAVFGASTLPFSTPNHRIRCSKLSNKP
jgi:uncharacterized protein (TIGR02452 family)